MLPLALCCLIGAALAQSSADVSNPTNIEEQLVNQSGTEQLPFGVKIAPPAGDEQKVAREEKERKEKALVDERLAADTQRIADYTRQLALFTFGLVVVAVLQACLFVWQLLYMGAGVRDSRTAAEAARDSANTAKMSMIAGDRAYVHYNGCRWISHRKDDDSPVFWRIRPRWINRGSTPTRQLRVCAHYELLDEPLTGDYQFDPIQQEHALTMLSPNGELESGPRDFFGADLVAVQEHRKHLYIWGFATYHDVFPGTPKYVTKFCVSAVNIMGDPLKPYDEKAPLEIAFGSFGKYNCADEDCDG